MKITIEQKVPADLVAAFYDLYLDAFNPLRTRAAARHVLTLDEFAEEMVDGRVDKYVVWDDDGRPIGLTTLTTDLRAVPWISEDFYHHRYPEHAARNAIYYLGYTLVHPDHESEGITARIIAKIVQRMHRTGGVCAFDVGGYNDATHGIGAKMAGIGRRRPMDLVTVDRQSYYAAVFHGPDAPAPRSTRTVSLAERPDLAGAISQILASRWPTFMLAGRPGHEADLPQLLAANAAHQVLLVDGSDDVLGVGLSLPLTWDGSVADLPGGWDAVVSASDALLRDGAAPNMVSALSVTLTPQAAGRGLAADVVRAMLAAAVQAGAPGLLVPVRPVWKSRYPLIPLAEYVTWRNAAGEVFDPWLRLHLGLGAKVLGIAERSLTVTGSVGEWEDWTGLAMPGSGSYPIPGGIVPLQVDVGADRATYCEPNVWVLHPGH
ncbi:MAG TPA: hypothetical protein VFO77_00900 [Actinoplanes sp.]|nr:hypothetical protein [Actinoplanes sp.]